MPSIETRTIPELEASKSRFSSAANKRESLYQTLLPKAGSPIDTAIEIGKRRRIVGESMFRLKRGISVIDQELLAINYSDLVNLRRHQLAELSELAASDNALMPALEEHQREFEKLSSEPDRNPDLKRAIERLNAEKAQILTPKPDETEKKGKNPELVTRTTQKRERTKGLKDKRPVTYITSGGTALRGKEGRLAKILLDPENLGKEFSYAQIIKEVLPGLNKDKARSNLNVISKSLSKKIVKEGFEITTRVKRDARINVTYYSARNIHAADISSPVRRETNIKSQTTTNAEDLKGQLAELFNLLKDTLPERILTADQITEKMWPGVDQKKARARLSTILGNIRKIKEYEVINIHNKREIGAYYLKRINKAQEAIRTEGVSTADSELTKLTPVAAEAEAPVRIIEKSAAAVKTAKTEPQIMTVFERKAEAKTATKIEQRDPEIKEKLHDNFRRIERHPEFKQAASSSSINRVFNSLKTDTIGNILEKRLLKPVKRSGQAWFDAIGIATLLYIYENRHREFPPKLLKQVQEVATKIYRERQERARQASIATR